MRENRMPEPTVGAYSAPPDSLASGKEVIAAASPRTSPTLPALGVVQPSS